MNWDQIREQWEYWKPALRDQWQELTSDDLEEIYGCREILEAKLHQRYGIAMRDVAPKVDYWLGKLEGAPRCVPQKVAGTEAGGR